METKIYSIVISSILALALIAGIPDVFAQNDTMSMDNSTSSIMNATLAFAQQENDKQMTSEDGDKGMTQGEEMGDMNQSQGNGTGMVQGQSNEAKNDGNNEEKEGEDE